MSEAILCWTKARPGGSLMVGERGRERAGRVSGGGVLVEGCGRM